MKAFHLAPHIGVSYWRNSPAGITPLLDHVGPIGADFAIVTIGRPCAVEKSARFELPADHAALDTFLSAIDLAYSLGHRDRANRMRRLMGHESTKLIPLCERCADDRLAD